LFSRQSKKLGVSAVVIEKFAKQIPKLTAVKIAFLFLLEKNFFIFSPP